MAWWRRIFRLGSRKNEKIPEHVDLWMRELIDEGMDSEAARAEAIRCFRLDEDGGEAAVKAAQPPICMKLIRLP